MVLILLFVRFPPFSETRSHTLLLTMTLLEAGISSQRAPAVIVRSLSSRQPRLRLDGTVSDHFRGQRSNCCARSTTCLIGSTTSVREHAGRTGPRSSVCATLSKLLSCHPDVRAARVWLPATETTWFSLDKVWFHSLCSRALGKNAVRNVKKRLTIQPDCFSVGNVHS